MFEEVDIIVATGGASPAPTETENDSGYIELSEQMKMFLGYITKY